MATDPQPTESLKVSNIRYGLLHKNGTNDWTVYEQGSNLTYQDNGPCWIDDTYVPQCMWYGVDFDYTSRRRYWRVTCESTFGDPTYVSRGGGPAAIPIKRYTWSAEIDGFSGKYSVPLYLVRPNPLEPGKKFDRTLTCSHKGKEIVRAQFTITQ